MNIMTSCIMLLLLLLLNCIKCMKSVVLIFYSSCIVGWAVIFLLIFAVEDHHNLSSIEEIIMNEGNESVEVALLNSLSI